MGDRMVWAIISLARQRLTAPSKMRMSVGVGRVRIDRLPAKPPSRNSAPSHSIRMSRARQYWFSVSPVCARM